MRSFELVRACAKDSDRAELSGRECLGLFFAGTIDHRDQLLMPLGGGPTQLSAQTRAIQKRVHAALRRIVDRGIADGGVRNDATPWDVIAFGALLAQPLAAVTDWQPIAARLADVYLEGLRPRADTPSRARRRTPHP